MIVQPLYWYSILYIFPYAPCMQYLQTIYPINGLNVGKYTIHGVMENIYIIYISYIIYHIIYIYYHIYIIYIKCIIYRYISYVSYIDIYIYIVYIYLIYVYIIYIYIIYIYTYLWPWLNDVRHDLFERLRCFVRSCRPATLDWSMWTWGSLSVPAAMPEKMFFLNRKNDDYPLVMSK